MHLFIRATKVEIENVGLEIEYHTVIDLRERAIGDREGRD